ncbi:MAG: FAD-dependent oxidoreductase [Elusimicrobia bacterium]|nr:FAD-dependent oxidoreductase [Elusimicrobiota bacterium]
METLRITFEEKIERAKGVLSFRFSASEAFNYTAGSYGIFTIEKDSKRLPKVFTFSSAPADKFIEFTTIMSGSDYKNALAGLQYGEDIELRGPMGKFSLDLAGDKTPVFLAGGIGITPFISMISEAFKNDALPETILFYANRDIDRIVFREELETIERKSGKLCLINVISDNLPAEAKGTFESGWIDGDVIKKYLDKKIETYHFYIVGPPTFNEAMEKVLLEMGVSLEEISLEKFSGY